MRTILVLATTVAVSFAGPAGAQTQYPLDLGNCGFDLQVSEAPERIVAVKSTALEMLLALGLEGQIVGVGYPDGPAPEPWTAAAAALPLLSDRVPSQEVVLETEPDLIYAGWESVFAGDGAGERAALASLGVATYVAPAACRSVKPEKLTFEALFAQMAELGAIVDKSDAAAALIAEQQEMLAGLQANTRGISAAWYSSGTKTPYVGAGNNAPAMLMEAVGLENIFADVDDGWVSTSWEAVADADPEVIVLVDAAWNSAEQKRELLATNPVTSQLDAVINGRYLVIPFPASEAGIRNVPAALSLAEQLAALDLQ